MIYDVYHDESKEEAFWHIFLFVPRTTKKVLVDCLTKARHISKYQGQQLSFKNLRSDNSVHCTKAWLSILSAAFQQKSKNQLEPYMLGRTVYDQACQRPTGLIERFSEPPRCKVAIFRLQNNHGDMTGPTEGLSKIETTFRMGLQGACHFLFSQDDPLEIGGIVLDREEHYQIEYDRDFDSAKVLNRLEAKFRGYCTLRADCEISGESISADDRMLLDLADLFLGAFRFGTINPNSDTCTGDKAQKKLSLSKVLQPLIVRLNEGYARMRNSRFDRFGTFSSAWIEDVEWRFEDIAPRFFRQPVNENLTLPLD